MHIRYHSLILVVLFVISSITYASISAKHSYIKVDKQWSNKKYDRYFKKYSKRYFGPNMDWRWFKAQAIAESGLKNNAKSRVGALGIMQIMPKTFVEIRKKRPYIENIHQAHWNIAAGIYYNRYMFKRIGVIENDQHKLNLTFASYNAGYGRVRKALKKSKTKKWQDVKQHVPKQTRAYVRKINELMSHHKKANSSLRIYINKIYNFFS
ncbi:MAG: murein transglycosylase [Gammaproteobacteria bacterium]|nr:MAG: murein transglycosylase [Gammaproteobacteria bacterium]